MYTSSAWSLRSTLSMLLAAAIVAVSGLALDRGHEGAARAGIVEIGQLAPVEVLPRVAQLPAVVVRAKRVESGERRTEA